MKRIIIALLTFALAQVALAQEIITTAIKAPQGIRLCPNMPPAVGSKLYVADAQVKGTIFSGGVYRLDPVTHAVEALFTGINIANKLDCINGGIVFCSVYGPCYRWDNGTATPNVLANFSGDKIPIWEVSATGANEAMVATLGGQRIYSFGLSSLNVPVPVAGNGTFSPGSGDGPALTTALAQPSSVARNPVDGLIYFGENGGHKIRRILANGNTQILSGNGFVGNCPSASTTLGACLWGSPSDLRFTADGSLYILDSANFVTYVVSNVATLGASAPISLVQSFSAYGMPGGHEPVGSALYVTFPNLGAVVMFGSAPATPTIPPVAPTATATSVPTATRTLPPIATPTRPSVPTASNTPVPTPTAPSVPTCQPQCIAPAGGVVVLPQ